MATLLVKALNYVEKNKKTQKKPMKPIKEDQARPIKFSSWISIWKPVKQQLVNAVTKRGGKREKEDLQRPSLDV